jgi:hypothetical protein
VDNSSRISFLFGAGASAPFGIPTMKKMVTDFLPFLDKNGTSEEIYIFQDIKHVLENSLNRLVDLEDIFTVIDGVKNFDHTRLDLISIYSSIKEFSKIPEILCDKKICDKLETRFENFIREECLIPEESYPRISQTYGDFFSQIQETTRSSSSQTHRTRGDVKYCTWTIFTTNYDTCLEYFWREYVRTDTYTGFRYDERRRAQILDNSYKRGNEINLVKLHGSLNWMIEPDGNIIEESSIPRRSFIGRRYEGPMMIYPIQQKELYVEPFISMFSKLNEELKKQDCWIIVGYSFNDPIIREIYIKNSNKNKKIILLHPHANEVIENQFNGLKGEIIPLEKYFGRPNDFHQVNSMIQDELKKI